MIVTGLAVAAAAWGVLMGVSPVLQIRRMVRQRSSRDVSIGYFAILLVGFLLWLSYGVAARNLALIVPNAVALLIGASTIAVALRLGQRTSGPQPDAAGWDNEPRAAPRADPGNAGGERRQPGGQRRPPHR
jgi:MtN3 and saliva related transmembrane protein